MVSMRKAKSSAPFLRPMLLLLIILVAAIADSSTSASCAGAGVGQSERSPRGRTASKVALFINAANGGVDWDRVGRGRSWEVRELVLDGFGAIMNEESFAAALDRFYPALKEVLDETRPDVLLASSKGIGVVAYLASKGLWVERPVVLFSPIPNPIDGLVRGDSYEVEWSDTIDVMMRHRIGPVLVAAGSSSDEEMLISQAIQEPSACGELSERTGRFEICKDWRYVVVTGDHGWTYLDENEMVVSKLIDFMFSWLESPVKDKM